MGASRSAVKEGQRVGGRGRGYEGGAGLGEEGGAVKEGGGGRGRGCEGGAGVV